MSVLLVSCPCIILTPQKSVASLAYKDSPLLKEVSDEFRTDMERRLSRKPELIKKRESGLSSESIGAYRPVCAVIPKFSVGCRRLTPGPGYLEALCEDNVRTRDIHIPL